MPEMKLAWKNAYSYIHFTERLVHEAPGPLAIVITVSYPATDTAAPPEGYGYITWG